MNFKKFFLIAIIFLFGCGSEKDPLEMYPEIVEESKIKTILSKHSSVQLSDRVVLSGLQINQYYNRSQQFVDYGGCAKLTFTNSRLGYYTCEGEVYPYVMLGDMDEVGERAILKSYGDESSIEYREEDGRFILVSTNSEKVDREFLDAVGVEYDENNVPKTVCTIEGDPKTVLIDYIKMEYRIDGNEVLVSEFNAVYDKPCDFERYKKLIAYREKISSASRDELCSVNLIFLDNSEELFSLNFDVQKTSDYLFFPDGEYNYYLDKGLKIPYECEVPRKDGIKESEIKIYVTKK